MEEKGRIMTVTGPIEPSELGITMPHEHVHLSANAFFVPPKEKHSQEMSSVPFVMRNLGWIRQNPYSYMPNLMLTDEYDAIKEEMEFFKENGGGCLVENSSIGLKGNLAFLRMLSEATGVKIVAGTGFYVEPFQNESVKGYTEEKMGGITQDGFMNGVEGVKYGALGEVGTSWPITDFEKRSLRSAASVQSSLGSPVIIHPGRSPGAPEEIMRIFTEAGGKADKTVMSHLDRTLIDTGTLMEFADAGTFLEYDLFGIETSHYQLTETVDMPSDAQRIQAIKFLLDNGLEDRILISHDIHTKHRLMKYGGHGFSHILVNIVPKMLQRGISQAQIDKMLKTNPAKWLTL